MVGAQTSRHLVEVEERRSVAVLAVVGSREVESALVAGLALPTWLTSWVLEVAVVPQTSAAQEVVELLTAIVVHHWEEVEEEVP